MVLLTCEILWSSWALVLVGIGAAWIAIRTLDVIKKQTQDTNTSAKAALVSAQALVNSERAWIDAKLIPGRNPATVHELKITNYGRTPAQILRCEIGFDSVPSPQQTLNVPEPFEPEKMSTRTARNIGKLIGGGEIWEPKDIWWDISKELADWNEVLTGTKTGLVHITIKYLDIVTVGGESQPRETSFLYCYLRRDSRLDRIPFHNKYT